MKILSLLILATFFCVNAQTTSLPNLSLKEDEGGKLDGTAFQLSEFLGTHPITLLFYVDPDEKDLNEEISEKLSAKNYPKDKVQSIAIINMAATWLPNFVLGEAIKQKQKKYPKTIYVKDKVKKGIKTWKVEDDQNNFLILDRSGKILFSKFGKLNGEEQDQVIKLIEETINTKHDN